ncbi:hypothetical protein BDF21DRAFT_409449, partial [Thamnidium elegans]
MGFSDKKNTLLNFKLISELITEATYLIVLIRKNRITKHLNRFHFIFFFLFLLIYTPIVSSFSHYDFC